MSAEVPLALIQLNADGKFELGKEAAEKISAIKGKIAVVSIAGLYRTGKSFILNRLLGRQDGFEIGATTNSCTKGIYIWGEPVAIKNEHAKSDLHVILMDTEGIGSLEKDQTHDAKIFSLAVLLSSFFIYNSMGVIDEAALEKISFIANLTRHIHIQSAPEDQKNTNDDDHIKSLAPYFPTFMWLLRDFGLKLVDNDNQPITSREYLEQALTRLSKDKSKNEIRHAITNVFVNRDCNTLVRPVMDEDELQNLDKIPYSNLREKFRVEVEALTAKIFAKTKPKLVFGEPISGAAYINLVQCYIDAINHGAVPTIRSAWENVSELENKKAVELAVQEYIKYFHDKIEPAFPMESDDLNNKNQIAAEIAREQFRLTALGETKQEFFEQLQKQLHDEFMKYSNKNDAASEQQCKSLLLQMYTDIDDSLNNGEFSTLSELARNWTQLISNQYLKFSKGKYKYSLLSEGLLTRMNDSMISLDGKIQDNLRSKHDKERSELHQQLNDEREEKKQAREQFELLRQDLTKQLDANKDSIHSLSSANGQLNARATELSRENQRLNEELENARKNPKKEVQIVEKEVIKTVHAQKQKKKNCVIQ